MAPKTTIKFMHCDDIRRVTVTTPTFEQLGELVRGLFKTPMENVKLSYIDNDGDKVAIYSQIEWDTLLQESTVPKIYVKISNRNQTQTTVTNSNNVNEPFVVVNLTVEPKYAEYAISVDEEHRKAAENSFHVTLQKYFEGQKIHPDNVPQMFKKSISFLHVSERAVVVEVGLGRFYKALFRKGLELVSFPATIPQGKQIFLEISELLQHPAVCWALAYVELLLDNTDKAKEYLQAVLSFDEDLWEGLETHDFFESLRDANRYPQLVELFAELSQIPKKKREEKEEQEAKEAKEKEEKDRIEALKTKWHDRIEAISAFGIEIDDELVDKLDRFGGDLDLFLNSYFGA